MELIKRYNQINPFEDMREFEQLMQDYRKYYKEVLTDEKIKEGVLLTTEGGSMTVLVTISSREDVKYQVTFFDGNNLPMSHRDLDEINYQEIPLGYYVIDDFNIKLTG